MTTMTGAELLREAARLMRKRAERAGGSDPSPWMSDGSEVLYVGIMADDPIGKFDMPQWADHAASWHPGVALAVADWLDLVADAWDQTARLWNVERGEKHGRWNEPTEHQALTVARAYLAAPVSAGEVDK